jgi:hypothetical protein
MDDDARVVRHETRGFDAVPQLGTDRDRAFDEERVESSPKRHDYERLLGATVEARSISKPEVDAVNAVLHDGIDRERQELQGALSETASARLVARKAGAVEEHDRGPALGERVRSQRAGGTCADDGDVETLHAGLTLPSFFV